jgi:hypothetical protein
VIKLSVNGIDFKTPELNEWSSVTISQAEAICSVIARLPKEEIAVHDILAKKHTKEREEELSNALREMSDELLIKTLPQLYGEIILILAEGLDNVDAWPPDTRSSYYRRFCLPFVHTLYLGVPQDIGPSEGDGFWVGLEYLYFPLGKEVLGKEVPMDTVTSLEFTEAADLQLAALGVGKDFGLIKNVLAILCRPKGEEYDEHKSLERAALMSQVKMDKVWNVFFCLINALNLSEVLRLTLLAKEWTERLSTLQELQD